MTDEVKKTRKPRELEPLAESAIRQKSDLLGHLCAFFPLLDRMKEVPAGHLRELARDFTARFATEIKTRKRSKEDVKKARLQKKLAMIKAQLETL